MELEEEIRTLLEKELNIKVESGEEKNTFFGPPFYLAPRDLLYMYGTLEKACHIKFTEQQVENYGFLCFENVVNSVRELKEGIL